MICNALRVPEHHYYCISFGSRIHRVIGRVTWSLSSSVCTLSLSSPCTLHPFDFHFQLFQKLFQTVSFFRNNFPLFFSSSKLHILFTHFPAYSFVTFSSLCLFALFSEIYFVLPEKMLLMLKFHFLRFQSSFSLCCWRLLFVCSFVPTLRQPFSRSLFEMRHPSIFISTWFTFLSFQSISRFVSSFSFWDFWD